MTEELAREAAEATEEEARRRNPETEHPEHGKGKDRHERMAGGGVDDPVDFRALALERDAQLNAMMDDLEQLRAELFLS